MQKWYKYTINEICNLEDLETISNILIMNDISTFEIKDGLGISEEDAKKMFVDIPLENTNENLEIIFFLEEKNESLIQSLSKQIDNLGVLSELLVEDDWSNEWKKFFKPFYVTDNIYIKPTWEQSFAKNDDIIIDIDPGTAFGTGTHETTKLCILPLKNYINSESKVLDLGTGSGILSIISSKLGCKEVLGFDIDEIAISTAYENSEINNISNVKFIHSNLIDDPTYRKEISNYNIILANILADTVMAMFDVLLNHINENTIIISSGILASRLDEVKTCFENLGYTILDTTILGEWSSITMKK